MKAIQTPDKRSQHNGTGHRAQAANREHARFDYQNELALIGAELRRLRLDQGYSIASVAKAVKMSKYRLARIEHGTYIHLGLPALYRLAEHYSVSPIEILSVIPDSSFDTLEYPRCPPKL